jgi:hypothetical protein
MYEDIKELLKSTTDQDEAAGLVIQYMDSAVGIDAFLDEDESPEWYLLPKPQKKALYEKMLKILGRNF